MGTDQRSFRLAVVRLLRFIRARRAYGYARLADDGKLFFPPRAHAEALSGKLQRLRRKESTGPSAKPLRGSWPTRPHHRRYA